jgi:protein tyrosine phosphatase
MTVCTMLQQSLLRGELNIITYLSHLLASAPGLELQAAQYIFIHDVLAEALAAGNTSVVKHNLPCYVRNLESSEGEGSFPSWKILEKHFGLATELHPPSHQYLTAVNPANQLHNNSMDYVATDLTRVVLQPMVGGTDYVNCSWVPGYSRADQFVLSQHPSPATIGQFWHMVWQTETSLIVCLSVFQQPVSLASHSTLSPCLPSVHTASPQFWPSFAAPLVLGRLRVSILAETSVSGYQSVSLGLDMEGRPGQALTQLIFCPNWPHLSVPVSNCVHLVDCLTRVAQPDKPTVVIDSFGATEAAIFVVLCSLVRQMDLEDNVDVFYWFKSVHLCRPGVWVSPDNLLFLYRVMAELCSIKRTAPKNNQLLASNNELNI